MRRQRQLAKQMSVWSCRCLWCCRCCCWRSHVWQAGLGKQLQHAAATFAAVRDCGECDLCNNFLCCCNIAEGATVVVSCHQRCGAQQTQRLTSATKVGIHSTADTLTHTHRRRHRAIHTAWKIRQQTRNNSNSDRATATPTAKPVQATETTKTRAKLAQKVDKRRVAKRTQRLDQAPLQSKEGQTWRRDALSLSSCGCRLHQSPSRSPSQQQPQWFL